MRKIRLVSVGRFSYPKRFEAIPEICARLVAKGLDVEWLIIGEGQQYIAEQIRDAIGEFKMADRVFLLGRKENPYHYIASATWYVQPSRYEGKSIAVREAQILGVPVIVTNYPTASSQVDDGVDGVIVAMETVQCAEDIAKALSDTALHDKIAEHLKRNDYGNMAEVEKIYALIPPAGK